MAVFKYRVIDAKQKRHTDICVADTRDEALHYLKERGFYILNIIQITDKKFRKGLRGARKRRFLITFTRKIAGLLKIGYTIDQALLFLQENSPDQCQKNILITIMNMVCKGGSFAQALEQFPQVFPHFYIHMIQVGENTGTLSEMLEMIARYLSRKNALVSRLRSFSVYPAIVFFTGLVVIGFLMGYVVPVLSELFKEFSIKLPWLTRFFFMIGEFAKRASWIILPSILAFFLIVITLKDHKKIQKIMDRLKIRIPGLRIIYQNLFAIQFSYLLAILSERGVPLSQSLQILCVSSDNSCFINEIERLKNQVSHGLGLAESLKSSAIFPKEFFSMIALTEKGMSVSEVFSETAHYYQNELEAKIDFFMKAIEPLVFIIVACFVATIVFSILLPLFSFSFTKSL